MSRAFVKEPDGDRPENRPQRPRSPRPNYITPDGLAALKQRLAETEEKRRAAQEAGDTPDIKNKLAELDDDLRYLQERIAEAIVVDPAAQPRDEVAFGAKVIVADQGGKRQSFTIVGEDEADAKAGRVSWVSPLARALQGARVGETVTWTRPTGDRELRVVSISYR